MAQSLTQKAVNNFVRGLITEAAELTFPEGASVDESNCELNRDGTRRRRLGVAYEDANVLSSFTISDNEIISVGDWSNVKGNPDFEVLVVQKGATLYFYNKGSLPYSNQEFVQSISLTPYEHSGSNGAENAKCQFTSIKGNLVVSSPEIKTIAIEYPEDNVVVVGDPEGLTVSVIDFRVRDFEWIGNTSTYYTDDNTPNDYRKYDAMNTGWNTGNGAPTDLTKRLTHPWFSGKDIDDNYSEAEFDKVYGGTSLTGNGHFILDFFNKDRIAASGLFIPSPPSGFNDVESSRFRTVESFSGRVFYAGLSSAKHAGTILFSRLVEDVSDLGVCHQQNDPTSEYLSDLLPTDGGEITIPDAVKITKLYSYQNSLFVFAENGVWQITGVDGVFTADAFSVNRVSRIGLLQPECFVEAEGVPFWWSRFGIHTLQTDPVSGQGTAQNLTIPTIQSFWDAISQDAKLKATGVYDSINKRIYWAYPDDGETVASKMNNFLILDIPLQAFFPWRIEDQDTNTDCVVGLAFYSGYGAKSLELDVRTNGGIDDVVLSNGDDVVSTQISSFTTDKPAIILLCRDGATNKMTIGSFSSADFLDWGTANYVSFAETGYDFVGDLVTKKNAPYIAVYSRLTEEGFTVTNEGDYEVIRPSSLFVSTAWDFNSDFKESQQAYRKKFPVIVDPSDLTKFDYPESVITTRLKVRGKGRSMRIRYESEQGKDFILLGWGIIQGRNPRF